MFHIIEMADVGIWHWVFPLSKHIVGLPRVKSPNSRLKSSFGFLAQSASEHKVEYANQWSSPFLSRNRFQCPIVHTFLWSALQGSKASMLLDTHLIQTFYVSIESQKSPFWSQTLTPKKSTILENICLLTSCILQCEMSRICSHITLIPILQPGSDYYISANIHHIR